MAFHRVASICGFAFIVLLVISGVLLGGGEPLVDDSVAEVREYLEKDEAMHRWSIVVGSILLPVAMIFFAGVVHRVRISDAEHGEAWGLVVLAGAVLLAAAAGIGDALVATMFFRAGEGLDDSTIRALQDGQVIGYSAMGPGIAAAALGVAAPALMHRAWPAWYGWFSLLAAVASVVAPFSLLSATDDAQTWALPAFPALLLWSLITSVLLWRGQSVEEAGGRAAAQAVPS